MNIEETVDYILSTFMQKDGIAKETLDLLETWKNLTDTEKLEYLNNAKEFILDCLINLSKYSPKTYKLFKKDKLTKEELIEIAFIIGIYYTIFDVLNSSSETNNHTQTTITKRMKTIYH